MEETLVLTELKTIKAQLAELNLFTNIPMRVQMKRRIGLSEMARLMDVDTDTMRNYITGDKIERHRLPCLCPAVKDGRQYKIPLCEFETWMDKVYKHQGKI